MEKKKIREETILFHKSFKLEFESDGSLVLKNNWDPRKIYFNSDFSQKNWTEIENKINNNSTDSQSSSPPNDNKFFTKHVILTLILIGILLAVLLVVLLLLFLPKKKKKTNNFLLPKKSKT